MRNKKVLISSTLLIICVVCVFNAFAHSGRTDSSGGHRDNSNQSGLGSYHYHCGGYPAHLHTNGVCPYKTTSSYTSTSSDEYDDGYSEGYDKGYDEGYDEGHGVGYYEGYSDRYDEFRDELDELNKLRETTKEKSYIIFILLIIIVLCFIYKVIKRVRN